MKKHAIIPIFIPHLGCPYNCIFCDQRTITAHTAPVSEEEVTETIETWLSTLEHVETREIAFYGGSFTAIPMELQNRYLRIAGRYKDSGRIHKIHLSTRPDAISPDILENLRRHCVDTIELGVQSFDDRVLTLSRRGHDSAVVYRSARMIQEYGFELGIQLMIGLPGDSPETCIRSARETVRIRPQIARLYPVIVIENTELYHLWQRGAYHPLTQYEAVQWTKEMYKILDAAGINIIRVGLKRSDHIRTGGSIAGTTFHPAFRQLVEGEIAKERIEEQLAASGFVPRSSRNPKREVLCMANARGLSNLVGNGGRNRKYFLDKYPGIVLSYRVCNELHDGEYIARIKGDK
ncbi:elongator complex protein 3 [Hornefia butyriciproducens]|uniref:elongator complex protein 3 n=1 Tax=Hornefia butyriciproducens TaxID=2652293 RepID=UPI0023F469F4|nr:radical SAM protein [Hornefia butyriciproducens]MDD6298649.1 radical SAM protein [Hornefia butyriciproducens]